jgi:hypothetical protein
MGANLMNARNTREREPSQPQYHAQQPSNTSPFVTQTAQMPSNSFGAHDQQSHIRSSTLPHQSNNVASNGTGQHTRHYQHNSMSIPKTRNISTEMTSSTTHNQRTSNPVANNAAQAHANKNMTRNEKHMYDDAANRNAYHGENGGGIRQHSISGKKSNEKVFDSRQHSTLNTAYPPDIENYDSSQSSPPLVSPALTYSSRGSGPSNSPTTPFIGSFGQGQGGEAIQQST